MPSRHPDGTRFSVKEQQELKNTGSVSLVPKQDKRTAQVLKPDHIPVPKAFGPLQPPPCEMGVDQVECWLNGLTLRIAQVYEDAGKDPAEALAFPRCQVLQEISRHIAKLKDIAKRCESANIVRNVRLNEDVSKYPTDPPYDDPISACIYAYHKLANVGYVVATDPDWLPTMQLGALRSYGQMAGLQCKAELQAVVDRVKALDSGEG